MRAAYDAALVDPLRLVMMRELGMDRPAGQYPTGPRACSICGSPHHAVGLCPETSVGEEHAAWSLLAPWPDVDVEAALAIAYFGPLVRPGLRFARWAS